MSRFRFKSQWCRSHLDEHNGSLKQIWVHTWMTLALLKARFHVTVSCSRLHGIVFQNYYIKKKQNNYYVNIITIILLQEYSRNYNSTFYNSILSIKITYYNVSCIWILSLQYYYFCLLTKTMSQLLAPLYLVICETSLNIVTSLSVFFIFYYA